ncbi:hypothetical protein L7F22_050376 [Adiantum nelumboides]|nr:hypothetical protein [Adiantum nelumboides]
MRKDKMAKGDGQGSASGCSSWEACGGRGQTTLCHEHGLVHEGKPTTMVPFVPFLSVGFCAVAADKGVAGDGNECTGGGSTNVNSNEANVQPMGVSKNITDQPITDVDVHDVLDEERAENEQARGMPKWLEPLSFDEAQNSKNWMAAMQSEFDALIENDTWTLCDLPPGKKAIGTKWVYKLKRKPDGEIDCYKARFVAKGYTQQKGIDYEETFAPTCRMTIVRFLFALAAHFGWDVHQSDIVTALLNGDIFEEVYVTQPRGFARKDKRIRCANVTKLCMG